MRFQRCRGEITSKQEDHQLKPREEADLAHSRNISGSVCLSATEHKINVASVQIIYTLKGHSQEYRWETIESFSNGGM